MRWKKIEKTNWRRVFVFWPKGTVDGFRVTLGYVWKRSVPIEDDHGLSLDSYVVDEYHTNPDGLEDEYQENKDSDVTQIQIGGNNSQSIQTKRNIIVNNVLTEGETLHHPKRPPKRTVSETVQRPKRPPPPAPPPIRKINEDVDFGEMTKWLDKNIDKLFNNVDNRLDKTFDDMGDDLDNAFEDMDEVIDKFFDSRTSKQNERLQENEKISEILKKRRDRRAAKKIVDNWPKWKKDFRLTKSSRL